MLLPEVDLSRRLDQFVWLSRDLVEVGGHLSKGHLSKGHLSKGHLSKGHLSKGHLSKGHLIYPKHI